MTTNNYDIPNASDAIKLTEAAIDKETEIVNKRIAEAIIKAANSGRSVITVNVNSLVVDYALDKLQTFGYNVQLVKKTSHDMFVDNELSISW